MASHVEMEDQILSTPSTWQCSKCDWYGQDDSFLDHAKTIHNSQVQIQCVHHTCPEKPVFLDLESFQSHVMCKRHIWKNAKIIWIS